MDPCRFYFDICMKYRVAKIIFKLYKARNYVTRYKYYTAYTPTSIEFRIANKKLSFERFTQRIEGSRFQTTWPRFDYIKVPLTFPKVQIKNPKAI